MNKERCLSYIGKLWDADKLKMFHHPVSATDVPYYYNVITSPIDLSTITKKIEQEKYNNDAEVQDDIALMIDNALEFNEPGSKWYTQAKHFRKIYTNLAVESCLNVDTDVPFIPSKRARDDERTLRKAEKHVNEQLDCVLNDLEAEKNIPIEELRAKYKRENCQYNETHKPVKELTSNNKEQAQDEDDHSTINSNLHGRSDSNGNCTSSDSSSYSSDTSCSGTSSSDNSNISSSTNNSENMDRQTNKLESALQIPASMF